MNNKMESFKDFIQKTVIPFADQFPIQFVKGKKDCQIAYRHFYHSEQGKELIILVNGRGENLLKWSEMAFDCYQQGYDVVVLDHRGQGYSGRLLKDREKGHLDEFSYYVEDLDSVLKTVSKKGKYQYQYLIGHSTGCLISAYYLANYDHHITRAVLSSPFWGVPTKQPIRDQLLINLFMIFGRGARYLLGKGGYTPINIEQNALSRSKKRMQWMNDIYQENPQLALGGPTFRWIHLCWQAIYHLKNILPRIEVPILVLAAGKEKIVNNQNLDNFIKLLSQGEKVVIPDARHEILFEQDSVRDEALKQIFDFLNA